MYCAKVRHVFLTIHSKIRYSISFVRIIRSFLQGFARILSQAYLLGYWERSVAVTLLRHC